MGNFYKDKDRAERWIESVSVSIKDPISAHDLTMMLRANTRLQLGERSVKDICDVLVMRGKLKREGLDWYVGVAA